MILDLEVLSITRRNVCEQCPHFRGTNTCGYLVDKTGKAGLLTHSSGIRNPRSRCPDKENRRWSFIPSYHAWYIGELAETDNYVLYRLTRDGVNYIQPIGVVNYLYSLGFDEVPRSILLNEIKSLSKSPNDYSYIPRMNLKLDYRTGDIYRS